MKDILAGDLDAGSKGRKLEVCVLFSDIRSFTTLSEKLDSEVVVDLLNRYFARMTEVVHRHGGTVDKFIGDGMMAFFGAPNVLVCPEKNALEAAIEMLIQLGELNQELIAEGREPIAIGVGIHSGEATIGYIGSPDRHEYTAIGDTVNTAARLEGLCKDVGHSIVCSESVVKALGNPSILVNLGVKPLKGRASVLVYGCNATIKSPT
jgi:class 3 adenylate cyclase